MPLALLSDRLCAASGTRRAAALLLLAAMVLAQMLGLAHGVLHGPTHGAGPAHAAGAEQPGRHAPPIAHADEPGHDLFGSHDDEMQCRLYDQLAHGDLTLHSTPLALSACGPALSVAGHPTWHLAAQAAGFLARAPPLRG